MQIHVLKREDSKAPRFWSCPHAQTLYSFHLHSTSVCHCAYHAAHLVSTLAFIPGRRPIVCIVLVRKFVTVGFLYRSASVSASSRLSYRLNSFATTHLNIFIPVLVSTFCGLLIKRAVRVRWMWRLTRVWTCSRGWRRTNSVGMPVLSCL